MPVFSPNLQKKNTVYRDMRLAIYIYIYGYNGLSMSSEGRKDIRYDRNNKKEIY